MPGLAAPTVGDTTVGLGLAWVLLAEAVPAWAVLAEKRPGLKRYRL